MKIKIRIRTPKGEASKTEKRITPLIIGFNKKDLIIDSYTNADDNEIFWEVEGPIRRVMKISRNVNRFDFVIGRMLDSKAVKKTVRKHLEPGQEEELEDMLRHHTSCEIIREATAEELADSQKSWWQRVKETYQKKRLA